MRRVVLPNMLSELRVSTILGHSTSIRMPWRQDSLKPSRLGAQASGYFWNAQVVCLREGFLNGAVQ